MPSEDVPPTDSDEDVDSRADDESYAYYGDELVA